MKVLSLTEPYEEGRYAWILENIQMLDNPIKAKGHLSIWNYEDKCKICDSENVNNGGIKCVKN